MFERGDVIEAALQAIAHGGYAGLTMRGVARSIGASLATVQRHFPTKDALWRGAVDEFLDGFSEPSLPMAADHVARTIEDLLGRSNDHPGLILMLFTDRGPGHPERLQYLADRLAARHDDSLAIIEELHQRGLVREIDGHALLLLLTVGVSAIASTSTTVRDIYGFDLDDPTGRARLAESLADILRFGLVPR